MSQDTDISIIDILNLYIATKRQETLQINAYVIEGIPNRVELLQPQK